jgi:hypothetical protein
MLHLQVEGSCELRIDHVTESFSFSPDNTFLLMEAKHTY